MDRASYNRLGVCMGQHGYEKQQQQELSPTKGDEYDTRLGMNVLTACMHARMLVHIPHVDTDSHLL